MERVKEAFWNGLLVLLVSLSIALSAQVWFPPNTVGNARVKGPSVQATPPSANGTMPDVFRPERIYVRQKGGAIVMLPAGGVPYRRIWREMQDLMPSITAVASAAYPDEQVDQATAETVTLLLPLPLTVDQWAQYWHWDTSGLRNFSLKVDRITLVMGKTTTLQLSGPTGGSLRLGSLAAVDVKSLKEIVAGLDSKAIVKYRPLDRKQFTVRISEGLMVADVTEMPVASLDVKLPDNTLEVARYFPDLSVVRQIEEKDAKSFTDGQRLLRITTSGQVDYLIAHTVGIAPDMMKAQTAAKDWVGAHGGWFQDLVMGSYLHQPGKTILIMELRMDGPFPVESAGNWGTENNTAAPYASGAVRLEITTSREQGEEPYNTVTRYRRFPDMTPVFGRAKRPVITAEQALQRISTQFPSQFLFEEVREMHVAYLIRHVAKASGGDWIMEPVWVVQVGEDRIYTPAIASSEMKSFVAKP